MVSLGRLAHLVRSKESQGWHDAIKGGGETGMKAAYDVVATLSSGKIPPVMLDPKLTR